MATILELNPQDFARSQQGSCIMTATDTTTGIKEPFALFDGRASGRTAVGRDGLIYDVEPYEPAFTLVDGQMVLSEEPLGENFATYSNSLTNWNNQGNSIIENGVAPNGLKCFDVTMSGSNTAINNSTSLTSGSVVSWFAFVKGNAGETIAVGLYSNNGIVHTFREKKKKIEVNNYTLTQAVSQFQFNTFEGVTAREFKVANIQVEASSVATSYIPTDGGTETRLAATGVKTPDISKWINSEDIVFRVKAAAITNGGGNRRISLNDSTTSNRIGIIYFGAGTEVVLNLFVNSSQIVNTVVNIGNHTDLNDMVFVVQSGNIKFFNNGTKLREQQNVFSFSSDISNITFFTPSSGNEPFYANVDTLQVMDYNTAIQEGLTYIND